MTGITWPVDFPADCPPGEASDAFEPLYRIVKANPPVPSDFESAYHKRRAIKGDVTQCQAMGLSVYTDIDDAVECARTCPKNGRNIALLTFKNGSAKVSPTKGRFKSHHTLWIPEEVNPIQCSIVIRTA